MAARETPIRRPSTRAFAGLATFLLFACVTSPRRTPSVAPPRQTPSVDAVDPRSRVTPPPPEAPSASGREAMAAVLARHAAGEALRGEFLWTSPRGGEDTLVALAQAGLVWARREGEPRGGLLSPMEVVQLADWQHLPADAHVAFDELDLDGDAWPELLLFHQWSGGPAEVTVWRHREGDEPEESPRTSWLLDGVRSREDLRARAPTLNRFVAPTATSPTDELVLRLQTATAAELRALTPAGGVTLCRVIRSRYMGSSRRCRRVRLRALPDDDVVPTVLSVGERPPRDRPPADADAEPPQGRWSVVWFRDALLGEPPTFGGGEAEAVSPPRPRCDSHGVRHRCVADLHDNAEVVVRFEWVFAGDGAGRRLVEITRTLLDLEESE